MGIKLDDKRLFQKIKMTILSSRCNEYAVERVAFGYEKPGDKAPIDLYLEHLFLGFDYEPRMRGDIPGVYIDEEECLTAAQDYDEYVHYLFVCQMERMFYFAPKDASIVRDGGVLPIISPFREYLFGLLPLFTEVLNVTVEYNEFDVLPTDKEERLNEYFKWHKFVTAILLEQLESGSQIDQYVKDIINAPHYVSRLIEKKGNNFYLKTADTKSYEYIFALFSLIQFIKDENGKLFELKMFEWERRYMANGLR